MESNHLIWSNLQHLPNVGVEDTIGGVMMGISFCLHTRKEHREATSP